MAKIFFSSIPKCGKNLLYSLFQGIGLKRYQPSSEKFAEAAYASEFEGVNYAYPRSDEPHSNKDYEGLRDQLVSMEENSVFHRHLLPLPQFREMLQDRDFKTFFVTRDPRDALLSAANYLIKQRKPVHIRERIDTEDVDQILLAFLRGDNGIVPFLNQFAAFHDWTTWEEVLTVRFEDLVGEAGGGSTTRQKDTVSTMLNHAGLDTALVDVAMQSTFNPRAGTFFRGKIGAFRQYFNGKVLSEFEGRYGRLLSEWGYE